jgi:hypothetical protein
MTLARAQVPSQTPTDDTTSVISIDDDSTVADAHSDDRREHDEGDTTARVAGHSCLEDAQTRYGALVIDVSDERHSSEAEQPAQKKAKAASSSGAGKGKARAV